MQPALRKEKYEPPHGKSREVLLCGVCMFSLRCFILVSSQTCSLCVKGGGGEYRAINLPHVRKHTGVEAPEMLHQDYMTDVSDCWCSVNESFFYLWVKTRTTTKSCPMDDIIHQPISPGDTQCAMLHEEMNKGPFRS